jgi:hypothetical protein
MKYFYTATVRFAVEHDVKPNLDSIKDTAEKCLSLDMAYENSENISDTGATIESIEVDWDTLKLADTSEKSFVLTPTPMAKDRRHTLGNITLEGMTTHKHRENDEGTIIIGGDLCDVHASSARLAGDKVVLYNVTVVFPRSLLISNEEIRDMAMDTIKASYASIGADTFNKTRREWVSKLTVR